MQTAILVLSLSAVGIAALFMGAWNRALRRRLVESEDHQADLRERIHLQTEILNNIPDIVWLKDTESRFVAVNEAFGQACGFSPESLVGQSDFDLWPDVLAQGYRADDLEVIRTGQRKRIEEPLVAADGSRSWLETIKTPVLSEEGDVVGTAGISRDITARKRAERAMVETQSRLDAVLSTAPVVLWAIDGDGRFTLSRGKGLQALGLVPDQVLGQSVFGLDEHYLDMTQASRRALAGETVTTDAVLRGRIFEVRCEPLLDPDGNRQGCVGVAVDITERLSAEQALNKSEERYRSLVETVNDWVWEIDAQGVYTYCGPRSREILGYEPEELIGKTPFELMPEGVAERVKDEFEDILSRLAPFSGLENENLRKDGSTVVLETSGAPVFGADGRLLGYRGIDRDITARRRAEEALVQEKERVQVTLHSIGDAVITTDPGGRVEYLNPVAENMTGWSAAEAKGHRLESVFKIVNEETRTPAANPVARCLAEGKVTGLANHTVLISRSGREYSVEDSAAPIRTPQDQLLGAVLVFKDATRMRRMAQELAHQASHDALTGLVNRREFERRLERALASAREYGTPSALCYLDLDQFKIINDTVGHVAGDELLRQVAMLLEGKVRARDTLARLGGDEFSLLLENCPLPKAVAIADSLVAALREFRFYWQERRFEVGVSIGLVPITTDPRDKTQLLTRADVACYTAKDLGRNRVHVYHSEDTELARRHTEILRAAQLRDALEQRRFHLYAQPVVPLLTRDAEPLYFEILLRLLDTDGSVLLPATFIPAAERYGLMGAIDRWVISESLHRAPAILGQYGKAGIGVNLSGNSLNDEGLLDFIKAEIQDSKLPPERVCFEITETAAVSRLSLATRLIVELKGIGCRFALDDFGSGLSSFGYLKHLPVDYLKIDGSFVRDMAGDAVDRGMVAAINQLGHVLGIRTIAEWVESEAASNQLRDMDIDFIQGHVIGEPVPLESLAAPVPDTGDNVSSAQA